MSFIKDKYIDMVKTRVDICKLVLDMHPGVTLKLGCQVCAHNSIQFFG